MASLTEVDCVVLIMMSTFVGGIYAGIRKAFVKKCDLVSFIIFLVISKFKSLILLLKRKTNSKIIFYLLRWRVLCSVVVGLCRLSDHR